MHTKEQKMEAFGRLLDIMDELRVKCPWDAKQTNESLRTNTIEETYELCEAIIQNSDEAIKKELGDVLLHVVFYAKIGEEKETFDIATYATPYVTSSYSVILMYSAMKLPIRPEKWKNHGNRSN